MAMMSKTKDLLEGIMREGSFKWAISRRTSFDDEFEEMGRSPSGRRKTIPELSPIANVIVGRCSKYRSWFLIFFCSNLNFILC